MFAFNLATLSSRQNVIESNCECVGVFCDAFVFFFFFLLYVNNYSTENLATIFKRTTRSESILDLVNALGR